MIASIDVVQKIMNVTDVAIYNVGKDSYYGRLAARSKNMTGNLLIQKTLYFSVPVLLLEFAKYVQRNEDLKFLYFLYNVIWHFLPNNLQSQTGRRKNKANFSYRIVVFADSNYFDSRFIKTICRI